jgi:hypothetical protein
MHAFMRRAGARLRSTPAATAGADHSAFAWDIEETGPIEFEPRRVNDRAWRLWLWLAVAVAIVGLGVAGRLTGNEAGPQGGGLAVSDPTTGAGPLIDISSPAEGDSASGGIVNVRGTTHGLLVDDIELAVVAGDALLGDAVLRAPGSGAWTAELRIFAPPVGTQVVLLAAPAQADGMPTSWARTLERSALVRRQLSITPAGPIGLWPPTVERTGGATRISISGCAPLTLRRLDVRLVTADGQTVATTEATIGFDAAVPGARGGYALGIGSFKALVSTERPVIDGALRVDVDWRDEIDGLSGTSPIAIPGVSG